MKFRRFVYMVTEDNRCGTFMLRRINMSRFFSFQKEGNRLMPERIKRISVRIRHWRTVACLLLS